MSTRTRIGTLALLGSLGAAGWLYVENRRLRHELDERAAPVAVAPVVVAPTIADDPWLAAPAPAAGSGAHRASTLGTIPSLPATPSDSESRLARRARRTEEMAALLGRQAGETDDAYKARVAPLITLALARPRSMAADMRQEAEAKAGVTPAQHAQVDAALDKVYDDALTYANSAIADGALTPDRRDVASLLEVAGGFGPILRDAQGSIGKVLTPAQMQAMYDSGFEWGEYLGASAPWERLSAPPAPK